MLLNECKYITTSLHVGKQFIQIGLKFIHLLFIIDIHVFTSISYNI